MNRQNIWNFWAKYYDRLWLQQFSLQPTRALVCQRIAAKAEEQGCLNILDMGCGTGQQYGDLIQALGEEQFEYLGIDQSSIMISKAQEKFPQADFIQSDVLQAKPRQAPFDLIICSHSFPYYEEGKAALASMVALLKPDASLLLTQACTEGLYDSILLKLTGLTTSTACYRSSPQMLELGKVHFRQAQVLPVSEQRFIPSLLLFHWQR